MKVGLLFAGQGSQYAGMGKDLYEHSHKAREVFDLAGEQIRKWCFEGSEEELQKTHITQPCVYTVTMAAYEAFFESLSREEPELLGKMEVEGIAGFSLGEYSALTVAGSIKDIKTGIDIVSKRGKWMYEAGLDEAGHELGGMVAALGDRNEILECVEHTRGEGILEGVNFNSPKQTVVAGDRESLERFKEEAKKRKIKAIPLNVSTAFHSPMMLPASKKMKELLTENPLVMPNQKVYSNVTAEDIRTEAAKHVECSSIEDDEKMGKTGAYLAELESNQLKCPVYWQEIVEKMIANGVEAFIEFGPGNVLTGINKKINKDILSVNVQDIESMKEAVEKIKEALC